MYALTLLSNGDFKVLAVSRSKDWLELVRQTQIPLMSPGDVFHIEEVNCYNLK